MPPILQARPLHLSHHREISCYSQILENNTTQYDDQLWPRTSAAREQKTANTDARQSYPESYNADISSVRFSFRSQVRLQQLQVANPLPRTRREAVEPQPDSPESADSPGVSLSDLQLSQPESYLLLDYLGPSTQDFWSYSRNYPLCDQRLLFVPLEPHVPPRNEGSMNGKSSVRGLAHIRRRKSWKDMRSGALFRSSGAKNACVLPQYVLAEDLPACDASDSFFATATTPVDPTLSPHYSTATPGPFTRNRLADHDSTMGSSLSLESATTSDAGSSQRGRGSKKPASLMSLFD